MAPIRFDDVSKQYTPEHTAVHGLDLEAADGEFLVLVGPSGCGKSTALRMVAGLEAVTRGRILVADRVVNDVPAKDRDIAMVFQSYALYPHMTVEENLGFGLKMRSTARSVRARRVAEAARLLSIDELLDRRPAELSGGQRQRVAMGRAIVREPAAFLMDEPLSNLDAKLRGSMRTALSELHDRLQTTTLYVTHDQTEAMTLGDRVAVMLDGRLQQVGSPQHVFDHPASVFVAGFIGTPPMNFAAARLVRDDGPALIFGEQRIALPEELLARRPGLASRLGGGLVLGVRPNDLVDPAAVPGASRLPVLDVAPAVVEPLGSEVDVHFTLGGAGVELRDTDVLAHEGEADVRPLDGDADAARWTARLGRRTPATPGTPLRLALDAESLYAFDASTGRNLDQEVASASPLALSLDRSPLAHR